MKLSPSVQYKKQEDMTMEKVKWTKISQGIRVYWISDIGRIEEISRRATGREKAFGRTKLWFTEAKSNRTHFVYRWQGKGHIRKAMDLLEKVYGPATPLYMRYNR